MENFAAWVTLFFTVIVGISTAIYAGLTWALVSETRLMRRAQTQPFIQVVALPTETWINLVELHIRNVGPGPARDIQFDFEVLEHSAGADLLLKDFTRTEFLNRGLRYLGPGDERISAFSQFVEAFEEKIQAVIRVDVSYIGPDGERHIEQSILDFSEFRGLSQRGTPDLHSIAQSLERLQKDFGHLRSGFGGRLPVDVFTDDDRNREREDIERRFAEMREVQSSDEGATDA